MKRASTKIAQFFSTSNLLPIICCLLLLCLSSCSTEVKSNGSEASEISTITIDMFSPDEAIEGYWSVNETIYEDDYVSMEYVGLQSTLNDNDEEFCNFEFKITSKADFDILLKDRLNSVNDIRFNAPPQDTFSSFGINELAIPAGSSIIQEFLVDSSMAWWWSGKSRAEFVEWVFEFSSAKNDSYKSGPRKLIIKDQYKDSREDTSLGESLGNRGIKILNDDTLCIRWLDESASFDDWVFAVPSLIKGISPDALINNDYYVGILQNKTPYPLVVELIPEFYEERDRRGDSSTKESLVFSVAPNGFATSIAYTNKQFDENAGLESVSINVTADTEYLGWENFEYNKTYNSLSNFGN